MHWRQSYDKKGRRPNGSLRNSKLDKRILKSGLTWKQN
jgi:hypothetical protein